MLAVGGALGLLAALVVLAAVLGLGPFGDNDTTESLGSGEFIARGDEVCRRAHDQFAELQPNPPITAQKAAALQEELIQISEGELDQIRALDAPPEVEEALNRYLRAREQGIALLKEGLRPPRTTTPSHTTRRGRGSPTARPIAWSWRRRWASASAARCRPGAPAGRAAAYPRRSRRRLPRFRRRPPRSCWASQPKPIVIARLPAPASHIPARAPGREKAGERDHSASVASSVPRSHARAHQS